MEHCNMIARICIYFFAINTLLMTSLFGIIFAEDKEGRSHTEVFSNKKDNSTTVIMRKPAIKEVPQGYIYIEKPQTIISRPPPQTNYVIKTEKIFTEQYQVIHDIQSEKIISEKYQTIHNVQPNTILKEQTSTIIVQKERKNYKVFIVDLETDRDHYSSQFQCYRKKLAEYPGGRGVYRMHWIFKSAYEPYFEMRWPISSKAYHLYNTNKVDVTPSEVSTAFASVVLQQFSNEAKETIVDFLIISAPDSNLFNARNSIRQLKQPQDETKMINSCFLNENCECLNSL